jgi:hypothetical protein
MKLRLDTFPSEQIAAQMPSPSSALSSSPPTLCCLLHTSVLPPSHQIRVWVGGVQQRADQEGGQPVFSWQCAQEVEMRIEILQQGRLTKTWRGWWRGGTTIAHTGNLAVQVFCGGVPQPAGSVLPTPALAAPSSAETPVDQHNGLHSQDGPSILTWPAFLPPPATPASPPDSEPEDDLWQTPPRSAPLRATPARMEEKVAEEDLDPERQEAEAPGEEEGREGTTSEEETEMDGEETEAAQREAPAALHPHSLVESAPATPMLSSVSAPAGTTIATFAALPVTSEAAHQEVLERLRALLALLPPTTILVDLRRHRSTRHRPASAPLGLSKDLLRTRYGARYWDRGLFIQIARQERVVLNPEDPDGLGALVAALARGWSLLILDGDPSYAESGRATVRSALRLRVTNLCDGPCF